jgi:hypothetical protein
MANFDRANRDRDDDRDERDYDGGMDDDENEGSHLPVVIIIAILVLAAFGGVVWLAYNQGVARGRNDGPPRIAAATKADDSGIKVYQQSAGPEEESKPAAPAQAAPATPAQPAAPAQQAPAEAIVSPPPPLVAPKAAQPAPPPAQPAPKAFAQPAAPAPKAFVQSAPPPKPQQQAAAAKPFTQPVTDDKPQVATKPPAQLGGTHPAPAAAAPAPKTAAVSPPLKPAALKPVAETPAKPAASGSYLLQVGAFKSDAEARAAWTTYQSKHAALLNGFGPDVQKVDLGEKGTWYRLRIASFSDKDAATALCDRLKSQGGNCFLAK